MPVTTRAGGTLVVVAAVLAPAIPSRAECPRLDPAALALAEAGDRAKAVNIDEAISKYQQATQLAPDEPRIHWKLALAQEVKEDWVHEVDACVQAEKADERRSGKVTHADYFFHQGWALEQLASKGDAPWPDARRAFETAIRIDPGYAQAHGELGVVLLHLDDERGALREWTTAVQLAPDDLAYAVMLADTYRRLMFFVPEEQVITASLAVAPEGNRHVFDLYSLLGDLRETRRDFDGAVAAYEAARATCAPSTCVDHHEAFFNLGSAYAETTPPRKAEAVQALRTFWKTTCKGALGAKYADECAEAQEIVRRLGASLQ